MEPGCEQYCERGLDEVEWQGGRVYIHLGAWRDGPTDQQLTEAQPRISLSAADVTQGESK
jgi:hypothetical protein